MGYSAATPNEYFLYEAFKKEAGDSLLVNLTNHDNAKIKAYAFRALIDRNYPDVISIVKTHLKDTGSFQFFSGCLVTTERINIDFILMARHKMSKENFTFYAKKIIESYPPEVWGLGYLL